MSSARMADRSLDCPTRKITYRSRAKARQASIAIRSRGQASRPTYPYHCRMCGMWHLTSQQQQPPRKDQP